jgi:aconitate hydratase
VELRAGLEPRHAAIVPRFLGLRAVLARSFARIHWQNLVTFAVLPLTFLDATDYDRIESRDILTISDAPALLRRANTTEVSNETKNETYSMRHGLTDRQVEIVLHGSLSDAIRRRQPMTS